MAYSQTGIVNLALIRMGANPITDIEDNSANAIKAKAVWDYVFDELMSIRDWKFAKTRYNLAQSTTTPLYAYKFAYPLPSDFLRLVGPKQSSSKGVNPVAYPVGYWYYIVDPTGYSRFFNYDPPVYPAGLPYVIETLPPTTDVDGNTVDGGLCLLIDYDNAAQDLLINYIRKISDYSLLPPAFVNCFADRLGAELVISITEDMKKAQLMMSRFISSLNSSAAVNECMDYLEDEAGSSGWEDAGR